MFLGAYKRPKAGGSRFMVRSDSSCEILLHTTLLNTLYKIGIMHIGLRQASGFEDPSTFKTSIMWDCPLDAWLVFEGHWTLTKL